MDILSKAGLALQHVQMWVDKLLGQCHLRSKNQSSSVPAITTRNPRVHLRYPLHRATSESIMHREIKINPKLRQLYLPLAIVHQTTFASLLLHTSFNHGPLSRLSQFTPAYERTLRNSLYTCSTCQGPFLGTVVEQHKVPLRRSLQSHLGTLETQHTPSDYRRRQS